ncbi:hypothetical protein Micbo1qcDRAFT_159606 [Microdochium bolleyi]|uniref:DRBM domain-containing protein n=1 Tax=Microdochium bolleyi TaxID=196109 RepID=A0A136JB78_9PEZI|nr:hypothetical protein Micbo1qcDRAFT_159606 [Microdochium bolleyi]
MLVTRCALIRSTSALPVLCRLVVRHGYKGHASPVCHRSIKLQVHRTFACGSKPRDDRTAPQNMAAQPQRFQWHLVKAWVEQKQAYEAEHGQPAPVSHDEEKAIAPLLRLLAPARPLAPAVGDENWVGRLQEYLQQNSRPIPTYEEEPDPNQIPGTPLQFRTFAHVVGASDRLPGPLHGLDQDGQCPLFPNKKLAKSYAAKCAYEYLVSSKTNSGATEAQEPASTDKSVSSPSTPASFATKPAAERGPSIQNSPEPPSTQRSSPYLSSERQDRNAGLSVPSSRGSVTSDGIQDSYVAKLAKLCQKCGIDAPEYKLDQKRDDYFDGHAVFKSPAMSRLPEGLGHVRNSTGKKETRERIAKEIYEHLYGGYQAHIARVNKFMTDLPPPKE